MAKNNGVSIYILMVIGFILSSSGCSRPSPSPQLDISLFLPESGQVEGWQRERALLQYVGEELFEYINGGAEIYHEYGFRRVIVQDFQKEKEHSLSAEIFEMDSPEAAYGIYTFKKSPEGSVLDTEAEGRVEGYYLNFWKDRYLVTLTGFDQEEETVEGLKSFARAIEDRIPSLQKDKKPPLARSLPAEDLVPGSEKYFNGNLGLFNSYPFSRQNIFDLGKGVKGSYNQGYDIYIFAYADKDLSKIKLSQAKDIFLADPKYHGFEPSDDDFYIYDDRDTLLYFQSADDKIVIVLGADTPARAKKVVADLKSHFLP